MKLPAAAGLTYKAHNCDGYPDGHPLSPLSLPPGLSNDSPKDGGHLQNTHTLVISHAQPSLSQAGLQRFTAAHLQQGCWQVRGGCSGPCISHAQPSLSQAGLQRFTAAHLQQGCWQVRGGCSGPCRGPFLSGSLCQGTRPKPLLGRG